MALAGSIVWLAEAWLWVGAAVAAVFVTWGIDRIDEDAQGAYAFRPLIVPGVMLLWPLVLWRWYVLESGRDDWAKRHDPPRRAHTWAALVMSGLILLALGAGLTVRQSWPADVAPIQLAQPGQNS